MKTYFPHIALALALWLPVTVTGQDPSFPEKDRKVKVTYDKAKDTSIVHFGPMHLTGPEFQVGELRLSGYFTYPKRTFVKPESVTMVFRSVAKLQNAWEASKQKDLEITADGSLWRITEVGVVDTHSSVDSVVDTLAVSIPLEVFSKIAIGRKVRMRLGDRTFDLDKQHLQAFQSLASRADSK